MNKSFGFQKASNIKEQIQLNTSNFNCVMTELLTGSLHPAHTHTHTHTHTQSEVFPVAADHYKVKRILQCVCVCVCACDMNQTSV